MPVQRAHNKKKTDTHKHTLCKTDVSVNLSHKIISIIYFDSVMFDF